jgi:hypothetical protein
MEPYRDTGPLACRLDVGITSTKGKTAFVMGGRKQRASQVLY